MSDWREVKRETNRGIGFVIMWILIVVAIILAVGAAIWGISVAVSGVQGQGDAVKQKNSSDNWVSAQARFEDEYQDIQATDKKIDVAAATLATNPTDKTAQQTLAGLKSYCISVVGEYNADARKYLSKDFRSADLPQQIDDSDPATDCKEN